ncbi:hypothetical protein LRP67_16235 [Nocardioides sp. cx-169]|uniref:phage tail tube protein n=1 Tax=Nocardioides sp. cx-169 TaxID=2899080 RepID=UPI001E5B69CB|nr:hypothetical protein [Nocardioides sp. cx-169]MCD4535642.1 hypothetical protein [Nocardioides sp. cx-169]
MSVIFPEATQVYGNTSVAVVQDMADMSAPDLSTDILASTTVNVSCFLYSGGVGTSTTNKGEAPRRLCTTSVLQNFGTTTYEVTDLQYTYDPQAALSTDDNKARAALTEGSEVYLILRRGLNAQDTAFAAGQYVDVWHVRLGPQNKTQTGDGEFDEYSVTQTVVAIEPPVEDVQILA